MPDVRLWPAQGAREAAASSARMGHGREQAGRVHRRCALVRCAHACCRLESPSALISAARDGLVAVRRRPADSYSCERARQPRRVRMRVVRKPAPHHSLALPPRMRPPVAARAGLLRAGWMHYFSTGAGPALTRLGRPSQVFHRVCHRHDARRGARGGPAHTRLPALPAARSRAAGVPMGAMVPQGGRLRQLWCAASPCAQGAYVAAFAARQQRRGRLCAAALAPFAADAGRVLCVRVLRSELQQGVHACRQGPGECHPRAQGPRRSGSALRCSWWSGPPALWSRASCAARWCAPFRHLSSVLTSRSLSW